MPKRDPEHMAAQRARILLATTACIAERGVEGTSIAAICKRADLSAGALYVHFRNRDEILAETVRHGIVQHAELPDDWPSFKAAILRIEDGRDLDIVGAVRAKMHMNAEFVRPGPLHDVFRPLLEDALVVLARHLQRMHDGGHLTLRFSAAQTALNINAYVDGMVWIALAGDQPLEELRSQFSAGLDALVMPDANRPPDP